LNQAELLWLSPRESTRSSKKALPSPSRRGFLTAIVSARRHNSADFFAKGVIEAQHGARGDLAVQFEDAAYWRNTAVHARQTVLTLVDRAANRNAG
jgi:hypothetical protein